MKQAFHELRMRLTSALRLSFLDVEQQLNVLTDKWFVADRLVLSYEKEGGRTHPVLLSSRAMVTSK